jgi:hypothetical protein
VRLQSPRQQAARDPMHQVRVCLKNPSILDLDVALRRCCRNRLIRRGRRLGSRRGISSRSQHYTRDHKLHNINKLRDLANPREYKLQHLGPENGSETQTQRDAPQGSRCEISELAEVPDSLWKRTWTITSLNMSQNRLPRAIE